jgi:hypothetical protein
MYPADLLGRLLVGGLASVYGREMEQLPGTALRDGPVEDKWVSGFPALTRGGSIRNCLLCRQLVPAARKLERAARTGRRSLMWRLCLCGGAPPCSVGPSRASPGHHVEGLPSIRVGHDAPPNFFLPPLPPGCGFWYFSALRALRGLSIEAPGSCLVFRCSALYRISYSYPGTQYLTLALVSHSLPCPRHSEAAKWLLDGPPLARTHSASSPGNMN